jgi:hypothetical protein
LRGRARAVGRNGAKTMCRRAGREGGAAIDRSVLAVTSRWTRFP